MGRVAVFIDGGYMDKILQNEFSSTKVSYEKFVHMNYGLSQMSESESLKI